MNVVVEIAGREALPVWTLPNVTGWQLNPNMMLNRLVDSCHDGYPCVFPEAFRVIDGRHYPIEQVTLNEIKNTIDRLESETQARNDKLEWQERSIKVLYQQYSGMYVWLDEFRKWFAHYVCWNTRCHYKPYSLCLYGELAQHFIDNELKIFKQRTTSVDTYSSDNVARNPESVVIGDLLAFTITDLLNKFELVNNDEYEPESDYESNKEYYRIGRQENTDVRRGYLYLWQLLLTDETAFIREADYENEATREAKLKNISDRLKEIKLCLEDCPVEDDSDPLMFDYGEPELLSSEARNFYQALKLLGDDWTAEEFALQVFDNGIRLFENNRAEKLKPITNIAAALLWSHGEAEKLSGESYPIEDILLNFKYSEPELSQFKPAYRYIAFDKAREIVARSIGDIEKAERFLMNRLNRCDIHAYHPFHGLVKPEHSMNGELWRAGYFPEWKLEQLIANEFGDTETPNSETNLLLMPDSEAVADNEMYKMPYTLAKRILKQKYHATQEEIALWIQTKEIIPKDAWVFTTVGKKEKELYRWDGLSSYEPRDLTSKLSGLYFNSDEINKFVPKIRWISFNQIVERWKAHGESIDEIVGILKDSIGVYPNDEEIKNAENLQKYQYPLADIEEIEKKLFPLLPETKAETVKGIALEAEDKPFNRLLSPHHEPDPRIRFRHKFGETLSLTELMQHWQSNVNFINELAFVKEIRPNLDDREARVDIKNGKRIFSFISLPTDGQDCIVEDIDDCPQYPELPDNTYFYWTDILSYEEAHPEIKKRILELYEERLKEDNNKANNEQVLTPLKNNKPRKKLKPLIRNTKESLTLIYKMTETYNVEYEENLPASSAWGFIISKKFKSDLIKSIPENVRGILVLNSGEELNQSDFTKKYQSRFK